jgi:hypothetical protein
MAMDFVRDRPRSLGPVLAELLQSLVLAASLGFLVPVLGISLLLLAIHPWIYVPVLGQIATATLQQILLFLAIFGNGYPVRGVLAIGLACGFVCTLFDAFVFYQYRNLRGQG